jgi:hypothetical protein
MAEQLQVQHFMHSGTAQTYWPPEMCGPTSQRSIHNPTLVMQVRCLMHARQPGRRALSAMRRALMAVSPAQPCHVKARAAQWEPETGCKASQPKCSPPNSSGQSPAARPAAAAGALLALAVVALVVGVGLALRRLLHLVVGPGKPAARSGNASAASWPEATWRPAHSYMAADYTKA